MVKPARIFTCIVVSLALAVTLIPAAPMGRALAQGAREQSSAQEAQCAPVPEDESAYVPGELIVTLDEGARGSVGAGGIETKLDDVDAAEVIADNVVEGQTVAKLELDDDADIGQVQQQVAQMPGVQSVQPNYRYRSMDAPALVVKTDDPQVSAQYYLESSAKHGVNARAAWVEARSDQQVTVAVFDTGFDLTHEDLAPNCLSDLAWDAYYGTALAANSARGYVTHGTHVAGIIAAGANNSVGIAGVSYNAGILPVKVFDSTGSDCDTATLTRAYNYLFKLVDAKRVKNLHLVNLSLGGYDADDAALESIINKARYDYDIVTVCSGGNGYLATDEEVVRGVAKAGAPRTDKCYPGDYDACVSVTALSTSGANCSWSDYNSCKDISAPGERVLSTLSSRTWMMLNQTYGTMDGTSAAAPVVTGSLALLWAANPDLTTGQALKAMYATAVPVTGNDRRKVSGSHGCVDAAAAVARVKGAHLISAARITVPDAMYLGSAVRPEPKVVFNGEVLERGVDYRVAYAGNDAVGTATLTVTGIGMYAGTVRKEFSVLPPTYVPISSATVSVARATYTGKALKPAVTVTYAGAKLVQGTDYTLAYSNNKKVGEGTVTVTGKGLYTGSTAKRFSIVLPAKVAKVKKSKVAKFQAKALKGRKARLSYKRLADASGYQVAFKRSDAKTWTYKTVGKTKVRIVLTKLSAKKKYSVKVRPYIKYASKVYYGKWAAKKTLKAKK